MHVVAAGLTDVGCVRKHNEDNLLVELDLGLFVVADGLGGHAAGEVASQIVVDQIREFVNQTEETDHTWPLDYDGKLSYNGNRLRSALHIADRAIADNIRSNPERETMGSTVVAALLKDNRLTLAHVGDSRGYIVNKDGIKQLTRDHSWVAEQVENGVLTPAEARVHPFRNVITQALGNGTGLDVPILEIDLNPEDLILLCSDGLTGMLSDRTIWELIMNRSNFHECIQRLVDSAKANGGEDNITVVLFGLAPHAEIQGQHKA